MRILQLGFVPIEAGGQTTGGIATHVWELSQSLLELGHELHVFALNRPGKDLIVQNIKVHHFPGPVETSLLPLRCAPPGNLMRAARASRGSVLKGIGKAYWVHKLMKELRPDLVHNHLAGSFFGPVMRALGWDVPMVLSLHSVHDITHNVSKNPKRLRKIKALFQANLQGAQAVITVHPNVAAQARQLGLSWSAPTVPVINAVSPKGFKIMDRDRARRELGLDPGAKIALFSGIMTGRKGEQELISGAKYLAEDVLLLMIGYGPKRPDAERMIRQLGLGHRIRLLEPVPRERMNLFYNAADIFVLPSHSEGFALSYLECTLCGRPFVADKGVAKELVDPRVCVLVDARDPKDIARGISQGLERDWDRQAIRQFGLRFAWGEQKARQYLEVYEMAIKARAS